MTSGYAANPCAHTRACATHLPGWNDNREIPTVSLPAGVQSDTAHVWGVTMPHPVVCKCGHPFESHREGFEWSRYGRGFCSECIPCAVYRPLRKVTR